MDGTSRTGEGVREGSLGGASSGHDEDGIMGSEAMGGQELEEFTSADEEEGAKEDPPS